ncbi:hypothetical protein [Leifsonia sp. AG29]|uniref:hypothetical protein n=1 Tax=Leifsonia sp. AG29 TaxID=2598860 RepID=UPI00131C7FB7|nr:hypothetical protein [Leifsonia sp. AG29]
MNQTFGLYPEAWLRLHAADATRLHSNPARRPEEQDDACEKELDRHAIALIVAPPLNDGKCNY